MKLALTENGDYPAQFLRWMNRHFAQDPDLCLEKDGTRFGAEHKRGASARGAFASARTASTLLSPLGGPRLPALARSCPPGTSTLGLGSPHWLVNNPLNFFSNLFSVWPADLASVLPILVSPRFAALRRFQSISNHILPTLPARESLAERLEDPT